MLGAGLSLLLIGLMRFGMGLLNIQGQVQGIAIGLLLILSILLPNIARSLSIKGERIKWQSVLTVIVSWQFSFLLYFLLLVARSCYCGV